MGQLHGVGTSGGGVGHDISSSSRVASAPPHLGGGHSRWRLRADRVPSHISYAIAEKIFFIGESIQLFESDTEGSPASNSSSTKKDVLKEEEVALYNQVWSTPTLIYLFNTYTVVHEFNGHEVKGIHELSGKKCYDKAPYSVNNRHDFTGMHVLNGNFFLRRFFP